MTTPRFPEVDEPWATRMRETYEKLIEEHLARLPQARPERLIYAWDALANDYRELACVLYASGETLDRVRSLLAACARAHLEVVKLRGASDAIPGAEDPPRPQDYATGNSCSTYHAIYMALATGEYDLARSLAPFVWDPPGARYVAANSVLCTNSQQALAYALKHFLLERPDQAGEQLAALTRWTEDVVGEMLMLRGIVEENPARMLDGLSRTLAWHARVAAEKENFRVAKYFLCIPALGASALAVQRGLLARERLPAHNVYFPRELTGI